MEWIKIKNNLSLIFILLLICGGIISVIYLIFASSILTILAVIFKVIICGILLWLLVNLIWFIFILLA